MPRPIAKFFTLNIHSKLVLIKVVAMLGYYRAAILLTSLKRLTRELQHHREEPPRSSIPPGAQSKAEQLAYLVAAAAAYTPWDSTCLAQVLTLQRLLAREKIGGRFYLGACRDDCSGELRAHAWLRCGERIINGDSGHELFAVVSTYSWLEP